MRSAHDHPSPVELQNRLKWYILGKHSAHALSKNSNTENDVTSVTLMVMKDVHDTSCTSDLTDFEVDDLAEEAKLLMQNEQVETSMIDDDAEEETEEKEGIFDYIKLLLLNSNTY